MAVERLYALARVRLPNPYRVIARSRHDMRAIAREGHRHNGPAIALKRL